MAYIGAEPVPGQNREVDDISSGFNGNATAFTLQVNSVNVSPESANNILINLGGVLQNPGTDYTVAASTLTFTTAPAAGLSFFGLILGAGINTATVADDTIGPSKLIDTAVTAGSYTTADITVDAQGRVTAAANGTIATAEIADQAVTNAKVNNSAAIAVSKLANFVTNNAADRIITGTGTTNTLNGRSDFTFNGATTTITNSSGLNKLILKGAASGALGASLQLRNTNTDNNGLTDIQFLDPGSNTYAKIQGTNLTDGSNNGFLTFFTASATSGLTERVRIDDAGNVGIGTTTPTDYNNLAENLVVATSSDTGITIATGTSSQGSLFFADGTSGSAMVEGFVAYEHSNNALKFGTSNSERMRINSSGRLLIGSTVESSHGGIDSALQVIGTGTDDSSITMSRFSNDHHSAYLVFSKSRNGSIGGNTVVQNGDSLGRITFFGNDGTDGNTPAAEIDIEVDATPGSNDMPGRIVFKTTADGSSSTTERMRIDSDGRVGIGKTPESAVGSVLQLKGNDGLSLQNNSTSTSTIIRPLSGNSEGLRISYQSDGGTKLQILSNGHYQIGAVGTDFDQGLVNLYSGSSVPRMELSAANVSSTHINFRYSTTTHGSITHNQTSVSYNTSSDYRLKENEVVITDGISRVKQLKPYKFNWKVDTATKVDGFFAHEVSSIVPEAINGTKDQVDSDNNPVYQQIDQSKLVPLLTAALQEAVSKIETLETKVAALEAA